MLNRTPSTLACAVLLLTSLVATATSSPTNPDLLGATSPGVTFLEEVADLTDARLRDDAWMEGMMPEGTATSPAAMLERVEAVHAAFAAAHDGPAALRAVADLGNLGGGPLVVQAAPQSLHLELLELYSLLGQTLSVDQAMTLGTDLQQLTPDQAHGLAILLNAVNQALAQQATPSADGEFDAGFDAVAAFFAAVEQAKPLLTQSSSSTASSSSSCGTPFEDPLKLIWYGTPCDDILPDDAARVLQVDPAGNDLYLNNAGGAQATFLTAGSAPVVEGGLESDRGILEVLDNVTLGPFFPLAPTNTTWQDRVLANLTTYLGQTVDNVTTGLGNQTLFLDEFIAGLHPRAEANESAARAAVPVAFAIDFEGNDQYTSVRDYVQGAAAPGALGVLLDFGGDDTYSCKWYCQGFGNVGLGLLLDDGGDDQYTSTGGLTQGSGDGGLLFDMAGNDAYAGAGFGVQGSYTNLLAPHAIPTVLFDRAGDDSYVSSGTLAQGAGAFLVDLSGNDHYSSTSLIAQGAAPANSLGLLLDASGDDVYEGREIAQGAASGGPAILADLSGNDAYTVTASGQGYSIASGYTALLYDSAGDDTYSAGTGQGHGDGSGAGLLIDLAGDDSYTASTGQGVSGQQRNGGALGLLVDVDGNDSYAAGHRSQGSGSSGGAGILIDVYGRDAYSAGDLSQGSGGDDNGIEELLIGGVSRPNEGGVGILLDGTQNQARATPTVDGDGEFGIEFSSPPEGPPTIDSYTAGHFSQGSSGSTGGIGLLLDRETKGGQLSTFQAGNFSQGAATAGGIGILVNAEGRTSYIAGAFSQGASNGGLGVLIDEAGHDTYAPTTTTSHGYGATNLTTPAIGLGLLLDTDGNDNHPGMPNNSCQAKGEFGLAVDTVGASLPGNCPGEIAGGLQSMVMAIATGLQQLLVGTADQAVAVVMALVASTPPTPPTGTIYFADDMESGTAQWQAPTSADGVTAWRLRNATTDPQVAPNAHTGSQYWYVGLPAGVGYTDSASATLTSNAISLAGATDPELRVWLGGTSETGFDFLQVSIHDLTAATTTQVLELSGGAGSNTPPAYAEHVINLAAHAGNTIELVFTFTADSLIPEGQGWNMDDVVVKEA